MRSRWEVSGEILIGSCCRNVSSRHRTVSPKGETTKDEECVTRTRAVHHIVQTECCARERDDRAEIAVQMQFRDTDNNPGCRGCADAAAGRRDRCESVLSDRCKRSLSREYAWNIFETRVDEAFRRPGEIAGSGRPDHPVAPLTLGPVHRLVGFSEQMRDVAAV